MSSCSLYFPVHYQGQGVENDGNTFQTAKLYAKQQGCPAMNFPQPMMAQEVPEP